MSDTIVLKPVGESIKAARDFVALVAGVLGIDDYLPRLVVSELVANAWRVSRDEGHIVVRAYPKGKRMVIEVWDQCDSMPVVQDPDNEDIRGRGLLILSQLVITWGTRRLNDGGKIVYAEVA